MKITCVTLFIICLAGCSTQTITSDPTKAKFDLTDIQLIRLSFGNYFKENKSGSYKDSLNQQAHIYVLDSLIEKNWFPIISSVQFDFVSPKGLEELVRHRGDVKIFRFDGAYTYNDLVSKSIDIEISHYIHIKDEKNVLYLGGENISYKYLLDNGSWKSSGKEIINKLIDYGGPASH